MKTILSVLMVALALASGCKSSEERAQKRHADLMATFPPGKTTRGDVRQHFSYAEPELSEIRPHAGWDKSRNSEVAQLCSAAEHRLAKRINRCDRYSGAAGFFSVGSLWFYYDNDDRVLDVEWRKGELEN